MLFKGRLALVIFGTFFFLLAWGISNQLIGWGKDNYACYHGRHYYNAVGKQRWLSISKLQLYYQPKTWGCTDEERYDPSKYEMNAGQLVPKSDSELTE